MSLTSKPRGLLISLGLAAIGMLVIAQAASANIVRPNGATPISASMAIAYTTCTTATPPGETHNPANLPGAACTPPTQATPRLTAGAPQVNGAVANFKGNVLLKVQTSPSDDVLFPAPSPAGSSTNNYFQDVRCTQTYAGGTGAAVCANANAAGIGPCAVQCPDYGGSGAALNVIAQIQITDQKNSGCSVASGCATPCPPTCPDDATVTPLGFAVPADCSTTVSTAIGGFCVPRFASANAECACVATGKASNIELLSPIFAQDGGDDGQVAPLAPDPDNPRTFAKNGLFLP